MKFPETALRDFFVRYPEIDTLLALIDHDPADCWLVGGCLRNFFLELPQNDIDIACSTDPTQLAKRWAAQTGGHWFWLDKARAQSRVVLPDNLTLDFNPLRADTIEEDLKLRDFTINSFALHLDSHFYDAPLLDLFGGVDHLVKKELHVCSPQSFSDDPLRILKGIRHAVTLGFRFDEDTWQQLCNCAPQLSKIAGERIRDELMKIFASENVAEGVQLLEESGVLKIFLGQPGKQWNSQTSATHLSLLNDKLKPLSGFSLPGLEDVEHFTAREMILFAEMLNDYAPDNCSEMLHSRLRLSRQLEKILIELEKIPDLELLEALATVSAHPRRQALLVEKLNPFAALKMLYWGVCRDTFDFATFKELLNSFNQLKFHGRIPDLLDGKTVSATLDHISPRQIGVWQSKIKLAEINGEIFSTEDAEKWLKAKLPFDNNGT